MEVGSASHQDRGEHLRAIGRCEKLILPPIIMNHILKVAYGHKKNNKTINFTLGGLGATALFDLLEGKNTKGFRKFIEEKSSRHAFQLFYFKTIS